jgi:phosphoribosylformimino-5-aminoimidazole carboxamide ribotide isomerase
MIIIPAIDLKEGKCVRLRQGRMESSTVFHDDPAAQARLWEDSGASRIHLVDLDGSVGGIPVNLNRVQEIVNAVQIPVQVGGGIRNADTIRLYLESGVATVILGTVAAKEPERALSLMEQFPDRISIGIDAKAGVVAVQGWTESAGVSANALAARLGPAKPVAFIYTDIDRDGMMRGPNIEATRSFAAGTGIPVILSGGVSTVSDIEAALPLEKDGVIGIIIGRALYEGTIDLKAAVRLVQG